MQKVSGLESLQLYCASPGTGLQSVTNLDMQDINHLLQAVASVENDWRQQNVEEYFGVKCHLKKEEKIQT